MFSILLCSCVTLIIAIYYISKRKFKYWKVQNVPHLKPTPIVGNYGNFIFQRKHMSYHLNDLCDKFPEEPYFGTFFGTEPTLVVKDPELIKLILTKDFFYFNGRETSNYTHKELFTQNLFSVNGDQWKVVRQNLTPVFSSAKMKNMFPLIERCSHEFESLMDDEAKVSNLFDARIQVIRFTMACITSCAFGIASDTLGKNYEDNPFTKIGNAFFLPSRLMTAKNAAKAIWPAIFYSLGFNVVPSGSNDFFKKMMVEIFEARQYKPSQRNDFVDFILNFKQNGHISGDAMQNMKTGGNQKIHFPVTDDLLLSQCVVFFLAGFETSATTASYTLFELAKHPDIQKKVQEEIDAYLHKYENKLTYEIVNELPYTFACVEEAMRLYPVLVNLTREVMEDYVLPTGVLLKKGVRIHIPVFNLHRNPKYFPEPEVYRPERFLGEERRNVHSYSYLPFGEGARVCIGKRFAKMQVLAGLVTLLKKFHFELEDNVPRNPEFETLQFIPTPKIPLRLKTTLRKGWENRKFVKT